MMKLKIQNFKKSVKSIAEDLKENINIRIEKETNETSRTKIYLR